MLDTPPDLPDSPPVPPPTPFPHAAWTSLYARYGDLVGRDPWHWAACHAVACARMGRHLTFQHAYPHFGMDYVLIVIRTGAGKTAAIRLAQLLLGPHVHLVSNVQSGQSLAESLADITWGKGRDSHLPLSVSPHPTLLIEDEFTRLLTQASLPGSTLLETVNNLYDAPASYRIQRVFRNNPLTIPSPSLSLLASTTQPSFHAALKLRLLSSGFLNRFLIFHLDGAHKDAFAPIYSHANISSLAKELEENLKPDKNLTEVRSMGGTEGPHGEVVVPGGSDGAAPPAQWNLGSPETAIASFYTAAALKIYLAWWERVYPIAEEGPLAPWFGRVQAHFHRIALCCPYYEHREKILVADARCAEAVMDYTISCTQSLAEVGYLPDRNSPPWTTKAWAETWILDCIARAPLSQRTLQHRCYNLADGKAKWLQVKTALDDLLKRGLLYSYADGTQHLLRLATAPR